MNDQRITATLEQLSNQAPLVVEDFFHKMVRVVDSKFGKDYSKKHPELIASLVSSCVADQANSVSCVKLQEISDAIEPLATSLQYISNAIENSTESSHA